MELGQGGVKTWGRESGKILTHHGVPVWLECLTGPDLTKTALHLEPASWVLVGNPSGDPGVTSTGADTPLCTLVYTVKGWVLLGTRHAWPQPV